MPWYTYILFGVFIIACFILIIVVLLQSGKGDMASAFGGGGAQTAFGPRGASSTLSRVTMGAAISFMVLAFVFGLPGVLSSGSAAHGIEDLPSKTQPAAPGTQNPAQKPGSLDISKPLVIPKGEQKPADKPAENKPADKAGKPAEKPAENKPADKK